MTTTNSQSNDLAGKTDSLLPSLVKIGVTSITVAAVLYPLERSIIRMQASGGTGMLGATTAPFMSSYKTVLKIASAHFRDFSTAAKGSFMKNTVIANKEDITETVDKQVIGSESTTKQLTTQGFLLSTTLIGGLDTVVTQYYANKRILTAQDIALKFSSLQQRFQFMLKGMPLRGTRNFFNAFACIAASNQLSGLVDPIIAKNKNPFLHHATTFILAGVPVAIVVTPIDVIYRKALAGIKLDTLEVPSYRAVCEDIFRNGGFKKFFCGAKPTAISTVLAYAVIHTTDYAINQLHNGKKFGSPASFFSSSDRPPSKQIDEKVNRPTI